MPVQVQEPVRPIQQPGRLPANSITPEVKAAHEALAQHLRGLDLSAIPELTAPPKVDLVSLAGLQQRRQLAESANAAQLDAKAAPFANIRELDTLLRATGQGGTAKCTRALLEELGAVTKILEAADPAKLNDEVERKAFAKQLEPHKQLIDGVVKTLATVHGYFLDQSISSLGYTIIPVDAVIEVETKHAPLHACVVGVGGNRGPRAFLGQAYSSGFAVIDSSKLEPGISLSRVLANELGHVNLSFNGGITADTALPDGGLKPPALPAHLARLPEPLAKAVQQNARPKSVAEVHELESDVWSTKVQLEDIDRILEYGVLYELDAPGIVFSAKFSSQYRLSSQLAFSALLASYVNDGKVNDFIPKINALQEITRQQRAIGKQIRDTDDEAKIDELNAQRFELHEKLNKSVKQLVSELPDQYRKEVRSLLEHYADSYLEQLKAGKSK